ncbi:MAG: hypothetical protein Q8P61_07940 [Candidatus Nanopelagicales bacterium]|nr:hypothetical protein [Candidatus Nanopelagicales bacterium]
MVQSRVLNLCSFAVPALSFIEFVVVGRLILSELLMLAMLPWLRRAPDRLSLPRWLVVLWAGWLLSQVATDLMAGSAFEDFARGWASIVFTLTNLMAILVLAATPKRARLFALGLAAGGVLGYLFFPHPYAADDPWKWALALPVGFAVAAGLSGRVGARLRLFTIGALGIFGALNLILGFRSLGGVSFLTAGYLILSAAVRRPTAFRRFAARPGMALAFLAVAVLGVLQLYEAAASQGWLGSDAQAKYEMQSGPLGVLVGGRSELLASTQAIVDSPILGHGSWAKDFTYVDVLADRRSSLGYEVGFGYSDLGLIPAHSYLMGSWVWAGLLGGVFWLGILGIAVRLLTRLYAFGVELAPLLVFSTMLLLWSIAFSPYGSSQRIVATYGIALCLLGLRVVVGKAHVLYAPNKLGRSPARALVSRRTVSQVNVAAVGRAGVRPK